MKRQEAAQTLRMIAGYSALPLGNSNRRALIEAAEIIEADIRRSQSLDPAGDFHRSKGCCDGSDPSACWRRQNEAQAEATQSEREANRAIRADDRRDELIVTGAFVPKKGE